MGRRANHIRGRDGFFHLIPPSHQLLSVQHDVESVVQVFRAVHRPLVHVALHCAEVPRVLAGGNPHPVTTSSQPAEGWTSTPLGRKNLVTKVVAPFNKFRQRTCFEVRTGFDAIDFNSPASLRKMWRRD